MPHIQAVFFEDPDVQAFLRINKNAIHETISTFLGYSSDDVGFYPHRIPKEDADLAINICGLEFIVNSGEKTLDVDDEQAEKAKQAIVARCPEASQISFAIWIIAHGKNGFAVHVPQ